MLTHMFNHFIMISSFKGTIRIRTLVRIHLLVGQYMIVEGIQITECHITTIVLTGMNECLFMNPIMTDQVEFLDRGVFAAWIATEPIPFSRMDRNMALQNTLIVTCK